MSSLPPKADPVPPAVSTPAMSAASSPTSSPEGGVRLADFSPQKVHQTATPAVRHGNLRKPGIERVRLDSDSDGDEDDVFSPEMSSAAHDPSKLFSRLSVSGTPSKASGKMPMSSELSHKRSVTFKNEAEVITSTLPGPSSSAKLSERRFARRGISDGNGVTALTVQTNVGQDQIYEGPGTPDPDPQELYTPSACIFVANLPQSKEDQALEAAVTRNFSIFGTVFVKIRRDEQGMPFAFCQFTEEDIAIRAMKEGKGFSIYGRACRTEMSRANRAFFISKRDGTDITAEEARGAMQRFGDLSKCERQRQHAPDGSYMPAPFLVEFTKFHQKEKPSVELMNNRSPGFKIEQMETRKKVFGGPDGDREYLRRYDINRRTVYITGFPDETTEAQLFRVFARIGKVLNIDLKPRKITTGRDAIAFVEYARPDEPDKAVARLNGSLWGLGTLTVQRKVAGLNPHSTSTRSNPQLKTASALERQSYAAPPIAPGPMEAVAPGPQIPGTPGSHHAQAHWAYQVGMSPMLYASPSANMPFYNPAGYGGSMPTTPSDLRGPPNSYLPGPGMVGPGSGGPGPAGPAFSGPGFQGHTYPGPGFPGPYAAYPPPHWMYASPTATHGVPPFGAETPTRFGGQGGVGGQPPSGWDTPTRSGAGRGMGRGGQGQSHGHGGGPENAN